MSTIRNPLSDSLRCKHGRDVRSPGGTSEPPSARSRTTLSSPTWASSGAVARRVTRASAPTTSTGAAGWLPTSSALPQSGPPRVAATAGLSSPRPRTRPAVSTAALGSSQTPATPRRTADVICKECDDGVPNGLWEDLYGCNGPPPRPDQRGLQGAGRGRDGGLCRCSVCAWGEHPGGRRSRCELTEPSGSTAHLRSSEPWWSGFWFAERLPRQIDTRRARTPGTERTCP